jgi:lipopolysaccharide assembly outer membrane protein LptD (OstA)
MIGWIPPGLRGDTGDDIPDTVADSVTVEEARSDTLLESMKGLEGAVAYWGKVIQTRIIEESILLTGEAGITYGETTLKADSIQYNYDTGLLKAWGSPALTDSDGLVKGSRMRYRLNENKGIIEKGTTSFDKWLFNGDVISKVGDRDLYGKGSDFTTCDLDEPHYHFSCSQLKLTVDDKVVARPVILYVRNIPVMFIPFFIFPIQKGRKSGFLKPTIGIFNDERRGRSITDLGYFFAVNDYMDITVASDLYENARWSVRGEGRYASRYNYNGAVFYSFTEDVLASSRRSLMTFRHNQTLNRDTSIKIHGNFASDRTIYEDISFDIDEVLQRSLESRATYNRRTSWGSFYVTGYNDYSLDRDRTFTQLPLFSLVKNSSPVFSDEGDGWYSGLNYSLNTGFESTRIKDEDGTTVLQASRTSMTLTDPMKLMGWLNLTPRFNVTGSYYHTRKDNTGFVHHETYEGSVSLFTRLFGIFDRPTIGPMTKWRHTISPQLSYRYRPDFDTDRYSHLPRFPGGGGEANSLTLSVNNDFDAKYLAGEEEKKISLLSVVNSTAYSFIRARTEGQSGWGNLSSRIESSPTERLRFSVDMSHSLFDGEIFDPFLSYITTTFYIRGAGGAEAEDDSLSMIGIDEVPEIVEELDDVVTGEERLSPARIIGIPWTFSLTHSFSKSRMVTGTDQSVYGAISFNPTMKWRLTYSARYSFDEDRIQNQRVSLRRDLHRWELMLSFVDLPQGRFSYELRVNLIDLPALEYRRSVKSF